MSEIKKFEELITKLVHKASELWQKGEGDLMLEVRNDGGEKKAKLKGGIVDRI